MKSVYLFLIGCLLSMAGKAQQNTILIIADDLGTDYLSFYPNSGDTATTPSLRSLVPNGVLFSQAWANPVCSPTRAGIFTGRYSFRTGVGEVITGNLTPQLDTSEMSIARLLRDFAPLKYATANIGKWHLHTVNPAAKKLFPNYMGYDLYAGNFNGQLNDFYNWTRIKNGSTDTITTYATTQTVNDAIDWLDTLSGTKPFFLWLAFNAPHTPHHKPPDSLITTPGLPGTPGHINANPSLYFKAAVEAMDTEIGRLFQYLDQHNLRDSTTIIFIGDNGQDKSVAQIQDTTHVKGTLYDYGIHVPMVISGPAVVNPGRSSDALVNTVDLFATVLELSGFTNWQSYIPAAHLPVDAVSLLPVLKNDTNAVRSWSFSEQFKAVSSTDDGKTIRNQSYQLINFDNGMQELYNVITDPLEQVNLLAQSSMTAADTLNFNELCTALNLLLGTSACNLLSTGIAEDPSLLMQVALVPNPSSGDVVIVSKNIPGIERFEVRNARGKLLMKGAGSHFNVSRLSDGLYFITVYTAKGSMNKSLMVNHL